MVQVIIKIPCFQYAKITTPNTLSAGKLSPWCSYCLQVVDHHSIFSEKTISMCPNTDSPMSKTLARISPNESYDFTPFSAVE